MSAAARASSIPSRGRSRRQTVVKLWAFRYSSEGASRSLYFSTNVETLRELYPDNPLLASVGAESRLVVSEPLGDLPGVWNEVPEATYGVIQPGQDELHPFAPLVPVG